VAIYKGRLKLVNTLYSRDGMNLTYKKEESKPASKQQQTSKKIDDHHQSVS
jgi:hypothetical protein